VVSLVPVTDQQSIITSRRIEGHWNTWAAKDPDATKASRGLVEREGGEIEVAADLVLDLKDICKVSSWWDWTVGAINTVLPRVLPLQQSIPATKCGSIHKP